MIDAYDKLLSTLHIGTLRSIQTDLRNQFLELLNKRDASREVIVLLKDRVDSEIDRRVGRGEG